MKIYLLTSIGFVSFLGITIGQKIDLCLVEDCTIERNLLLQESGQAQVNFEGRNQMVMNK